MEAGESRLCLFSLQADYATAEQGAFIPELRASTRGVSLVYKELLQNNAVDEKASSLLIKQ